MNKVPNPDPHTRLGAYALCVDGDRMLQTQLWNRDSEPGSWTLPGGGSTVAASWVPIDEIASLPLTSLAHRGAALARARVS